MRMACRQHDLPSFSTSRSLLFAPWSLVPTSNKASISNCFQKQHLLVYLWIHRLFLHCFCSLGSFSFSHPFQTFLSEKSPNHVQIVLRPLCTFLHCFVISLLSMSHCIPFLWDTAFAKLQIKTAQEWSMLSQLPHRRSIFTKNQMKNPYILKASLATPTIPPKN